MFFHIVILLTNASFWAPKRFVNSGLIWLIVSAKEGKRKKKKKDKKMKDGLNILTFCFEN